MPGPAPTPITYNGLLAKCQNEIDDTSAELQSEFEQIQHDAEIMIFRSLNIKQMDQYYNTNFTNLMPVGLNNILALPPDFELIRSVYWYTPVGGNPSTDGITDQNGGNTTALIEVQESYLRNYWNPADGTGNPKYFAQMGLLPNAETTSPPAYIMVAPTPPLPYAVTVSYFARPQTLSDLFLLGQGSSGTTYISTWYADTLFYACMVRICAYIKSVDAAQIWQGLLTSSSQQAVKIEQRKRSQSWADASQSAAPIINRTPTQSSQ